MGLFIPKYVINNRLLVISHTTLENVEKKSKFYFIYPMGVVQSYTPV